MAIVQKYKTTVRVVRRILPDVYSVTLESVERPFRFRPGQFLHLALDPYDSSRPWPESRCFSIQSPFVPGERVLQISFATKGEFTRRMSAELVPGREVWLKLPYGDLFRADDANQECVFIAGGTGVTPFLSLFSDQEFRRYSRAFLYLGVRSAAYHVFGAEIERAVRDNPAFMVEVFQQDSQGLIPIDRIAQQHGKAAIYYLSGPAGMIRGFRTSLLAAGVPAEQVRSDDWE
jgi:ferredoxin-NADP reductase